MNPPHIDRRVLKWLEEVFPDKVPSGPTGQRELGLRQGEQRVIRKLRKVHEDQEHQVIER